MSKRDDRLLINDVISSLRSVLDYTKGMSYDGFLNSRITVDAVIRNFEIIGEAANYISPEFKINNSHIQWRKLTDFRNRLIHHYFGINYEIVWDVIKNEVVDYLTFLEAIE